MKIVISTEGGWGTSTHEQKTMLAESLKAGLEHQFRKSAEACQVEVVKRVTGEEDVKPFRADILVFLSRSELRKAKRIKSKYPKLKVVVLTGLIPRDEVVVASTSWVGETTVFDFVLHGQQE